MSRLIALMRNTRVVGVLRELGYGKTRWCSVAKRGVFWSWICSWLYSWLYIFFVFSQQVLRFYDRKGEWFASFATGRYMCLKDGVCVCILLISA